MAIIGVDTGAGPSTRQLGLWERHRVGEQEFWFLPVVALDPADQNRRVPHSIRLIGGILRYWRKMPQRRIVQVHRMDSAAALRFILPAAQVYCVHTQENGLVGTTSDSFWRYFGILHQRLEQSVVRNASAVVVFNEDYAKVVQTWNPRAVFSPTWYDPALIDAEGEHKNEYEVLWVGRLETPKDPELAVRAFRELMAMDSDQPWTLQIVGSGTRTDDVEAAVRAAPELVQQRIVLRGRVEPSQVAQEMGRAGIFLMTSHPGYEGYPRVLVEAMASGLPAVVTQGSDTGLLVADGVTGYTCSRNPQELAARIDDARAISRSEVKAAVAKLDAPSLVSRIFSLSNGLAEQKDGVA
ncbi:glycosyltransferase [Kocuria aegyptia]|uniref:glycosyltransferase n=1 Tax=Kocuria aegyptia TaxID=330943 RepID=UPI0031CEF519